MITMTLLTLACNAGPAAPAAITYDHTACSACGMLISDPHFAAQLVTREGERRYFDDPVCLFRDIVERHPSLANVWFRDFTATEDVWLPYTAVGFVEARGAPMAGGLAAVPVGTPGAVTFGEASSRALAPKP
jgi:copper chaperone NosL